MNDANRFLMLGIGGAGGRIVNQVAQESGGRLRAAALDTDFGAVAQLGLCQQYRFGSSRFDGSGSGGNSTLAHMAAEEEAEVLRKMFSEVRIAIVVTGLGGGTGSGITPVALRVARELNVRTLVFATLPFAFEGDERRALASRTTPALDESGDVVALFENESLCSDVRNLSVHDALAYAGQTLSAGITLLWRMVNSPGYVGLDFATLSSVLRLGRGRAQFAFATSRAEQRLEYCMSQLLDHPELGIRRNIPNIPAMLIGILGGNDLRLKEVGDIMARLKMEAENDCDIRMGTVYDAGLDESLAVAAFLFKNWSNTASSGAIATEPAEAPPVRIAAGSGQHNAVPRAVPRPATSARRGKSKGAAVELVGERFRRTNATLYEGEDLDVPTYIRRGIPIDAN